MRALSIAPVLGVLAAACGQGSPSAPTPLPSEKAAAPSPGLTDLRSTASTNEAPVLRLKTNPAAVAGDPYPVISGRAPLTVRFNLCESSDPDQVILEDGTQDPSGDTLNWQFHFGDDGTPAFNDDGSFNPDAEHFCRTEHTYTEGGRYVATLTVTDKHLEDQSNGVAASARETLRITIDLGGRGLGSIDAALTTSDPLYDPPDVVGTPPPPCVVTGIGDAFYYDTYTVSHLGGRLDIEIVGASFNTWINLYQPFFNPAAGCQNLVASDDDGGSGDLSRIASTFPAGEYTLVVTSYFNFDTGTYSLLIRD
jgi:hypothetical protein